MKEVHEDSAGHCSCDPMPFCTCREQKGSSNKNKKDGRATNSKCIWTSVNKVWACVDNTPMSVNQWRVPHDRLTAWIHKEATLELNNCPAKCIENKDCTSCLSSRGGGDGYATECHWSTALNECISPQYIALRCLGGVCGSILSLQGDFNSSSTRSDSAQHLCPKPCSSYNQCRNCLQNTKCGWCAITATNGGGACVEGTIEGPLMERHCTSVQFNYRNQRASGKPTPTNQVSKGQESSVKNTPTFNVEGDPQAIAKTSWHYYTCPVENECLNGHHLCDAISEVCVDQYDGFVCNCSDGYHRSAAEPWKCEPFCEPDCVHGLCVSPNKCDCEFSYVGLSCNVSCNCNGHSDCTGPDPVGLNRCLECKNNTMGARCEYCQPFFVGNPKDGSSCTACLDYCNGHSKFCFNPSLINTTTLWPSSSVGSFSHAQFTTSLESISSNKDDKKNYDIKNYQAALWAAATSGGNQFLNLEERTLDFLVKHANASHGPTERAICVNCEQDTTGLTCDRCISGHYRETDNLRKKCKPCDCNGHGDICNEVTGDSCHCQNNTMSDIDHCRKRRIKHGKEEGSLLGLISTLKPLWDSCHEHQCSKCKEYYIGYPTDSHQCYRQMTVDTDYCLDPKTQSKCYAGGRPAPLEPGQTVYFAVLPKFMNVDIRVVVDVTDGDVDVFFSPEPQMFIVNTDKNTWAHNVYLDPQFVITTSSESSKSFFPFYKDEDANNGLLQEYYEKEPIFSLIRDTVQETRSTSKEKDRSIPGKPNKYTKTTESINRKRTSIELENDDFFNLKKSLDDLFQEKSRPIQSEKKQIYQNDNDAEKVEREKREQEIWGFRIPKGHIFDKDQKVQSLRSLTRLTGRRMHNVPALLAKNITRRKGSSAGNSGSPYSYIRKDCDSEALHTFVRLPNPRSVLHVRNLRNRLVISLPEQNHDLRSTRFFLIIRSREKSVFNLPSDKRKSKSSYFKGKNPYTVNATYGSLVFRQDQLHIDLFVFFSVFFSCFFLFLSACVIVWKVKAMSDMRRARRRHAVEMQYMAQRPFASQTIIFEPNKTNISLLSASSNSNYHRLLQLQQQQHLQPPMFEPYLPNNQIPHRHANSLRHNIVYDSLSSSPILTMPPPSIPAPRPPSASSSSGITKTTSRSISILNSTTAARTRSINHSEPENEEAFALQPMISSTSSSTSLHLRPLAIEPTNDQSVAVATVLIQLPKCTSESRRSQGDSQSKLSPLEYISVENDGTLVDGASAQPRSSRSRCDIVPVTVGGGNSQTLSFGCVLVSMSQNRLRANMGGGHTSKSALFGAGRPGSQQHQYEQTYSTA